MCDFEKIESQTGQLKKTKKQQGRGQGALTKQMVEAENVTTHVNGM